MYESSPTISTDYRYFKIVLPVFKPTHSATASRSLHLPPFTGCLSFQRVKFKLVGLVYCSLQETPPLPICHLSITLTLQHDHFDLLLPTFLSHNTLASRGFRSAGPPIWNSLPSDTKLAPSFSSFRFGLETRLQLVNN